MLPNIYDFFNKQKVEKTGTKNGNGQECESAKKSPILIMKLLFGDHISIL